MMIIAILKFQSIFTTDIKNDFLGGMINIYAKVGRPNQGEERIVGNMHWKEIELTTERDL